MSEDINKKLNQIIELLDKISSNLDSNNNDKIVISGLSPAKKELLDCITLLYKENSEAVSIEEIARKINLSKPTISGYVAELTKLEYLTKITALKEVEDRRKVRYHKFKPKG